jgi:alpha-D-xyloside xylohydrolase
MIPAGAKENYLDDLITLSCKKSISCSTQDRDQYLIIKGFSIDLQINKNPWSFLLKDRRGRILCAENPGDIDGLGQQSVPSLGFAEHNEKLAGVVGSFHLRPDEHLYGLGEKFTRLDKVCQKIVSWTVDALGSTSERSHKNIPFLMSNYGYGLFLNSSAKITWELGTISSQSYSFFQETPLLDAYFIYGPTYSDILYQFNKLTGPAAVPPKWTYGLWLSSTGAYRDQKSIENLIDGAENNRIPLDVIHIDTWWMRWRKYCDFTWDKSAFPEYQNFLKTLHQNKLKVSLWIQPYISIESELFQLGKQRNYFVKNRDGEVYIIEYGLSLAPRPDGIIRKATESERWNAPVAIIDFTNPAAYRWFQDLARPVLKEGIAAFKTDFGEDIPKDALFHDGTRGATIHNLYPLLYNRAIFEVTQQEKGYGVVWARSAFTGSQRFPLCWSGDPAADWDSLAATIRGGLSIGMSGIPFWSHDIGGYRGIPSPELFIRWAQFGLFCSHSRMHGDSPREPWYYEDRALKIVRKYLNIRYQLFPYLYSTALQAADSGLPVIRSMPLAFPDDPNTFDKDFQYMFGPMILVAPVYRQDGKCTIYLPDGEWYDFHSGQKYRGPKLLKTKVPLSKIPLYIKGGAILPMMAKAKRIPESRINPLILNIYPAQSASYTYLEDEGKTEFQCNKTKTSLDFTLKAGVKRDYILKFYGITRFNQVAVKDKKLSRKLITKDLTQRKLYLQIKLFNILDRKIIISSI